ncbi:hypothetical protein C8J57DRAFT_759222 [Mycena rebaudengoi]|nr:hypothetical protein C8J57DRAFT_759222 [Mycena rebaudengoi]
MHPALETAQIVQLICNSVEPNNEQSREGALWALARTATTFTHSALNGLWAAQPTLINVLRCLPPDLLHVEGGQSDEGHSFHLLRTAKQTDLERLLSHSVRVRALELTAEAVTPRISGILEQIRPFSSPGLSVP